jgi:hypothetical protein
VGQVVLPSARKSAWTAAASHSWASSRNCADVVRRRIAGTVDTFLGVLPVFGRIMNDALLLPQRRERNASLSHRRPRVRYAVLCR